MEKNYAYQSGAFMALAKLMAEAVRELDTAKDEYDRKWARQRLTMLAEQTADTLTELGYADEEEEDEEEWSPYTADFNDKGSIHHY